MTVRARMLIAAALLALLAGVGCKPKEDSPARQGGPERSPALLKQLRQAQARAERRPRDLAAQLQAGKLSYDQGLYNDAFRAYQRAAAIDPQNVAAMTGLARTNLKLLNPTQGLDWVGRARRQRPNDPELVQLQARLFLLAGKMDQAIAGFQHATRLQPNDASNWLNLASTYGIIRQYGKAVAAARRATALAPHKPEAHYLLGRFSEKNGDRVTAEREYRAALKLEPQQALTLLALARLLVDQKRKLDEARDLAIRASQIQVDRADAAVLAAWVLHLKGDDRKAADELMKVVNSMPQYPEGWEKLAVVLQRLGQTEQAAHARKMAAQFVRQSRPQEMEFVETH